MPTTTTRSAPPARPAADAGVVLSARGLTRQYGKGEGAFTALRGVDLDIRAGTTMAVVGKSGSGKSTLMHLLALLDRPTGGSLAVDGIDTSSLSATQLARLRNERFGFVFQQFFLIPHRSVLDNVALPLLIAGVPARERRRRAEHALALLGLADKARNRATDLSGGQKQRVVIARALVNGPSVIFADEPTGNLDSATGAAVAEILFGLHREHGLTVVLVTHDEDLAARCEHRIELSDGRITGGVR